MEAFDYDHDGDTDILLGSMTFPNLVPQDLLTKWGADQISILLIRNKLNHAEGNLNTHLMRQKINSKNLFVFYN